MFKYIHVVGLAVTVGKIVGFRVVGCTVGFRVGRLETLLGSNVGALDG